MAEARRNWIRWWLLGALCLSAHALVLAQSSSADSPPQRVVQIQSSQFGSLAGRLTDLRSAPLAAVSIVLRNQSTGTEFRTTTAKNGSFRFASLDAGEYTLDADAAQLGHGQLEGIVVTGGVESRVQAAMKFEPAPPALLEATAPKPVAAPPADDAAHPPANGSATVAPAQLLASNTTKIVPAVPVANSTLVPPPASTRPSTSQQSESVAASPIAMPAPSGLQAQQRVQFLALPPRPALETQAVPVEIALSVAQTKVFPLKAGVAPVLSASAAPPSLAQAAMFNPPGVSPALAVAPTSDPVAPALSTSISAAQLQALPASGRRWQDFLLDTPAASASADSSQASYRGSQQSAEMTIDGASIALVFGASASSGQRASDPTGANSGPQKLPR